MSNKSYKSYIKKFNFADARFETLPKEVFFLNRKTLSENEVVILNAIKFQMKISHYNEKYQTTKQCITNRFSRFAFAGITYTIVGFLLLSATYYANINLNLGMDFLTEFFA